MSPTDITPETRIADLLDAYPTLEPVLIAQAPCFAALQNPILRKTVARVATLEKAAQMGGLPVKDLVARLRSAAGLPSAELGGANTDASRPRTPAPGWVVEDQVAVRLDADALLAAGEVPLTRLHQAIREAAPRLVCLTCTFRPAPLLEALQRAGHATWTDRPGEKEFHVYIRPK